ncbi:Eukaryotic translation initiation factor 1A, X-chromosomal [Myotis davidii]|uniref:Eukaryotic translation initiation factor 1A, X-chromosomal n=1 Tax=Myotis davidii TaxID=225400 RepID=L5LJH7_MYODS|nr:Eukaryotic translation initiation factor 1A, X-chromosomal [Myotis davidii]
MPKNKGKGGKNRRRGKNENESEKENWCSKKMGKNMLRGKLRKKVWINTSDIILVGLRDYQDNKADVILKYNADEARSLKAYGELPEHAKINETDTFGPGDDDEIQFDDIGDDDEDIDDI